MSARRQIVTALSSGSRSVIAALADVAHAEQLADAYRAEILAEAKVEVVAWLVKKAREGADVSRLASQVDRGAVRAFLGTGHYRDAMDAHRAEVLAADGQAYDGELAMLRDLVRTLRTVVRPDDADMGEVRQLLHHHASDDAAAREKSSPTGADATPAPDFFQPGHAYTHRDGSTFRCVAVTTHPDGGERVAIGWHTDTAGWTFVGARNINHWNHEYDGVQPPAEGGAS